MSESEDFLKRWSRRKREAAEQAIAIPAEEAGARLETQTKDNQAVQANAADPAAPDANTPALPFDLSKLPSIESIGPATDIRIFMQPGVPAALTRAALRRAWSADPAIRDYIGLSENSWDFTAPDSMAGFGSIDPKDVARLLSNIIGSEEPKDDKPPVPGEEQADADVAIASDETSESVAEGTSEPIADAQRPPSDDEVSDSRPTTVNVDATPTNTPWSDANFDATQHSAAAILRREEVDVALQQNEPAIPQRRPHGRALPE